MAKLTVDPDVIRALAALLDETNLSEIEWEENDHRVRVSRGTGGGTHVVATGAPVSAAQTPPPASAAVEPALPGDYSQHPGAVKSPMVGTAYLAPEPGAAPFVKEGDAVSAGQTLLIVEAMKTMNPIAAPRGGQVRKVLVSDATPVEYGEALMIVE